MTPEEEQRGGVDRRSKRRYRFHDRRTGFDRRKRYPILGTLRDDKRYLLSMLVLLNLLSVADGLLTAWELHFGLAREGNPLFAQVISANPLLAVVFKLSVVMLVSIGIWHYRSHRAVVALVPIGIALYGIVLGYHLGSLGRLGLMMALQ